LTLTDVKNYTKKSPKETTLSHVFVNCDNSKPTITLI
jgi:hypothetical protein